MTGNRELLALRSEYCTLLSRLFLAEAAADLMRVLAQGARERGRNAAAMDPLISEGWFQLGELCAKGEVQQWADDCSREYVTLFVGPGIPRLTPCESYYRSGRAYGPHLALVRGFMEKAGLEAAEDASEPADHISFEFQILQCLIEKQASCEAPDDEAEWLSLQGEFVRRHLGAWAPRFFEDIANEKPLFFGAFAKIGSGYIAWERSLLKEWGPQAEEENLVQIRLDRPWKGPLFDPSPPHPERIEQPLSEEKDSRS